MKLEKQLSTYLGLCTEVYELSKPQPPEDAYAFYRHFAQHAKGPILEPMCGTGRFLLPLLEEGFDIHGFDASHSMLERLQQKAKIKKLAPKIWEGFVQDLQGTKSYHLIFIPSGSFCLITEEAEALQALKTFYDCLEEGGTLLFEAETIKAVPQEGVWSGSHWTKPDGMSIILSQFATFQEGICSSLCKYELVSGSQIIHTEIETLRVKIYEQQRLITLLQKTGFQKIRPLKAFSFDEQPGMEDETIVYECRK